MTDQPISPHRADRRATVRVLSFGTLVAVAIFVASFVARLLGDEHVADTVGAAAVLVLLGTPAAGLATTAAELRSARRPNWFLALVVLLILGVAVALALLQSK